MALIQKLAPSPTASTHEFGSVKEEKARSSSPVSSKCTILTPNGTDKFRYLTGNFAPIQQIQPLTPCAYTGTIPDELYGGEYVRNGGNPVANEDLGRDSHWFDGDGMLSGVAFRRTEQGVQPEFVNQYILTDVYLSSVSSKLLQTPILPSIATLVNPVSTLCTILLRVLRTLLLVALSHLSSSVQAIKRISVANTSLLFHDGRALATCESGPPMRILLPSLETVGWYNGKKAEGEQAGESGSGFGGDGLLSFMKEWTTAHPRVDSRTGELVLFHSTFVPPYIHYSIIPATYPPAIPQTPLAIPTRLFNAPVPGMSSGKMMHDFGVSFEHTIILDLPLSLDPLNLARNRPVISFDASTKSRFGVFPRYQPERVRWFETSPCCIFHTANTWDDSTMEEWTEGKETQSVKMLACRLTSASLIFSAGNVAGPNPLRTTVSQVQEQCRLYYYNFEIGTASSRNEIKHQFALSAIPFEFPSIRDDRSMLQAKYIYGCSIAAGSFSVALGRAVQIDCLVKIDAEALIKRGEDDKTLPPVTGCVDQRTVMEIIVSKDVNDPIQIFKFPRGYFAQEPRFVPRADSNSEDDGFLLTYVFDEAQLDSFGECRPDATSELWIVDAKDMKTVVGRVSLPQRVPYGLHGSWFSEAQVMCQRPVESIRQLPKMSANASQGRTGIWAATKSYIEYVLG